MADTRDPLKTLRKLYVELYRRRPTIDRATSYYDGDHNLAFSSEKFLEAFGGLFRAFADNWCEVVVNAVEERIHVQGFRVDEATTVDDEAKAIWERNDLDLQSLTGHADGLIAGAFYTTTWPGKDGKAEITVDPATSTIVECHPKIRTQRTAGLRCWLDDDGYEHAELFYPDEVYLFRSRAKRESEVVDPSRLQWVVDDYPDTADKIDESGAMSNPYGVVPVVEFRNRPRLHVSRRVGWAAHSELAAIIPVQDAVNKLIADLLVASEFAAYPQRYLTGYEPQDILDPNTGKPTGAKIPPNFKSGPGNVWWLEDPAATFGAFQTADLSGLVSAIEMAVQHIASISATPPHYLNTSADRLSGESIKSAESGLIAKVRRKLRVWGASWEETMRIAGLVDNIPALAEAKQMETVFADPETRTESEHVDAVSKKQALNVPDMQLWEELGYTDEQVQRFPAMRAQQQLEGMAAAAADRATLPPAPAGAQGPARPGGNVVPIGTAAAR